MNILQIIAKKRDKQELSKQEIDYFIQQYTKGIIPDYQMASLLMAIFLNGMSKREITDLTLAMAYSGEVLDLSSLGKIIVDKHSTGGVGDKVSLILLPLVASLGVPVAKMSGRGLGFTGGTVDKLESIPGYQTDISIDQFKQNVKDIGISMISQTMNLAPADKKMYRLRDSISCVESIPLIASSIMSKKIASGAQKIVLDVTVGDGAFMKTIERARELAHEMIEIGKLANRETVCVLTSMEQPLGYAIGNQLEVIEAVECLQGNMPEDVKQVVLSLGSEMLKLSGLGDDLRQNKDKLWQAIQEGKAYEKFLTMVSTQGGDISYLQNSNQLIKAKYMCPVISKESGFVQAIPAEQIGKITCALGAGRIQKEDQIDPSVGIVLHKKIGDYVEKGEVFATIHANQLSSAKQAEKDLRNAYQLGKERKQIDDVIEIIQS